MTSTQVFIQFQFFLNHRHWIEPCKDNVQNQHKLFYKTWFHQNNHQLFSVQKMWTSAKWRHSMTIPWKLKFTSSSRQNNSKVRIKVQCYEINLVEHNWSISCFIMLLHKLRQTEQMRHLHAKRWNSSKIRTRRVPGAGIFADGKECEYSMLLHDNPWKTPVVMLRKGHIGSKRGEFNG